MAGLFALSGSNLKTISLGELDKLMDAAAYGTGQSITPTQALTVPLAFRAVDMIAGAVSRMPYYIEDEQEKDVTEDNTPRYWIDLNYKLASSLLLYNAAYCLKESNVFGLNARWRFLPTPLVSYKTKQETNDLEYFEYKVSGTKTETILDFEKRLLWWWWPNMQSEIGPGVGPMDAALGDVGLARSLTTFAESYFKRGGFPITLLKLEGNLGEDEQEKVLSWWNSMIAGARRAFRAIILTNKITPQIIGSNIKDTIAPELYMQAARNVSIAFGIPLSMLLSDAANYATALEDHVRFYTETVIPLHERMIEVWNERVYEPQGLTIEADPDALEVMQQYQLQTAAAVVPLVGKPVLTMNEGRAILGYELSTDPRADELFPAEQPAQPVQPASTSAPAETTENETNERDDAIDEERKQLKRYAHNRLKDGKAFTFRSDVIRAVEVEAVRACKTHQEIDEIDLSSHLVVVENDHQIDELISAIKSAEAALNAPPPQPINIYNNIPPTNVTMSQPDVKIMQEPPIFNLTVEPAPVTVQNAGDVNVTVEPAPPATVTMEPNRTIVMKVKRDGSGQIAGATAEAQ